MFSKNIGYVLVCILHILFLICLCVLFSTFSQSAEASNYYQSKILTGQTLALDLTNDYYAQPSFLVNAYTMDIQVSDFDKDNCMDAAVSTFYNTQHKVFWGNCDGTWTEADAFGISTGWGIDAADFNGDGFLDVVLGTYPGFGGPAGNYLFINNKDRTFAGSVKFGSDNTTNLQAQDLDNDNFPDVVVPVAGQSYTYTNNKDGTFTPHPLLGSVNTMNLKLFDIDKDGDLDVLKSEYSGWSTYNINNGDGSYTPHNVTTSTVSDMQPIDFDKDGDWDFTVANNGQNFLYINNGDGTWTQTNQFGSRQSNVHTIKDLDGNGYDDVVVANGAWGGSQQNYVYYNNGNGTFTESPAFGTGSTYAMHFVDIDGDGDEDAVNGNWNNNGNVIYYNGYYPTTTKNFSYPVSLPADFVSWNSLEVAESKKPGTDITYTVYPEDVNKDGICNDGTILLGPVGSNNNSVDLTSLNNVSVCIQVTLSTSRVIATPKVTMLKIKYGADSSAPTGLDLVSPSGYTRDSKPTLTFKKAIDTASGILSYTVSLDDGKATSWSTSGIPATGDASKPSSIWKNDSYVKIEFDNENDTDAANDTIKVYFKNYDANDLTEGKHYWKVTAYDNAGNSKEESKEFYLDRTNPTLSELNWINTSSHIPTFSGKVIDTYNQGNTSYDKISSGPRNINLNVKKKDGDNLIDYLSKDYSLSDTVDISNSQKYAYFSFAAPGPLEDGFYQAILTANDQAGNTYSYPAIDIPINVTLQTVTPTPGETKIISTEKINPPEMAVNPSLPETVHSNENKVMVQVKVLDKKNNPVYHAKVELHSDPMIAYTNEDGVAVFEDVPTGQHTINITYANYHGEQKVMLSKDNTKQYNFDIKVTEEVIKSDYTPVYLFLLTLVVAGTVFIILRARK